MNIQKNNLNVQNPSFSGHRKTLDKYGYEQHNFYYLYDSLNYGCEVELYNIAKDKNGNFSIEDKEKGAVLTLKMKDGGITEDLTEYDELSSPHGFAYRFKLTNNETQKVSYGFDNGTIIGIFDNNPDNKFNVVLNNRAMINKNGAMQLIMPDEYFPGVSKDAELGKYQVDSAKRQQALKSVRTHANKLGGKFAGIIKRLPELQNEGVKRIVGTPFTRDTISSHLYWTENAYQVAPNLGTEDDFKELQVELFKNGINWIADAALVNEGFGGIHLTEVLRKGNEATSKNMFRSSDIISLGVLPDKAHEKGFTRMKIINAPFNLTSDGKSIEDNPKYDVTKPTYIQFYDERLASEEQKDSQSPERLATYDKKNTDNVYDITKHDDAVYPFPFEVSPTELERNIKRELKANGQVALSRNNTVSDVEAMKRLTLFSNFNVVTKENAGGLEVWDGNVDIAKLNFYRARNDYSRFADIRPADRQAAVDAFDRGALAVRDYAVNSGKYWTQLTADAQLKYVSEYLSKNGSGDYITAIKEGVKNGALPKSTLDVVDEKIIENVENGKYNLRRLKQADMRTEFNPESLGNNYSLSDYVMKKSMDLPLETLPIATNLLGILTSPYLTKRANVEEELAVSRYDLSKANNPNLPEEYRETYDKMDDVYSEITRRIEAIVTDIPNVKENGQVTDYGKYVISEIAPDLTKYLLLKSFNPNADVKLDEKGKFDFSSVDRESMTMQSLGIPFDTMTAKEEAAVVVKTLSEGIEKLTPDMLAEVKYAVENRFADRSLNDFRVAEMILDRTESGLGWRIDAAKDIASIDGIRSKVDSFDETWDNVIDFWKLYNQSILQINPHAYTTAEITDVPDLFNWEADGLSDEERKELQANRKYKSSGDAERKFLEETGITSLANYNYFFSLMPELFSKYSFEKGEVSNNTQALKNEVLTQKLDTGWCHENFDNPGFLFNSPADGVENSYTFFGNHDKPRPIHGLALNMGLFNGYLSKEQIEESLGKPGDDWHEKRLARDAEYKKITKEFFEDYLQEPIVWDRVNTPAVAMGSRLKDAIHSTLKSELTPKQMKAVDKALVDLATGTHLGSDFDATAFGTRPFEVALDTVFAQVEYNDKQNRINAEKSGTSYESIGEISNLDEKKAAVLKSILEPAFERMYSMYKLLVTLPGSPTDFAGDRVAASGYETKAKNYHQQNRNTIRWEWIEGADRDPNYKFVMDYYKQMNQIANLRTNPKLSALNDGATITSPVKVPNSEKVQSFIRYNNKDSVILSLHDLAGTTTNLNEIMNRGSGTELSDAQKHLYFYNEQSENETSPKRGLKFGIEKGTKFKNALDLDNPNAAYYEVDIDNKGYYIQKKISVPTQGGYIEETQPIVIEPRDLNTLLLCKIS